MKEEPTEGTSTSNQHRESPHQRMRQRWRKMTIGNKFIVAATIVMAAATVSYSIIAACQLNTMKEQLDEMKEAQRPWVGVAGNVQLRAQPKFHILPVNNQISVELAYTTHAFGTIPAPRETDAFKLIVEENPVPAPVEEMRQLCAEEEATFKDGSSLTTAVFPGGDLARGAWYPGMIPKNVHNVQQLWFIGCFVYENSGGQIHHTKYWFQSWSNSSVQRMPAPGAEQELSYTPFEYFALAHTEAD